jgi:hypothetical protein
VLLRQLGINLFPLGLEEASEDGVAGGVSGAFQIIEGGLRLEPGDISVGEIEGGELSHRLACRVVHAADQHTDVAHGVLLDQDSCPMVTHLVLLPVVTCPATYSRLPFVRRQKWPLEQIAIKRYRHGSVSQFARFFERLSYYSFPSLCVQSEYTVGRFVRSLEGDDAHDCPDETAG